MTPQSERRVLLRRGYLIGKQRALRPPSDRKQIIAQARQALGLLPPNYQHALIVEQAIYAGEDGMTRAISLLLSAVIVIARRMNPLSRKFIAAQIIEDGERLFNVDDEVANETRH